MTSAPTNELGTPGGIRSSYSPQAAGRNTWEIDPLERSYELKFPHSIAVYDRMRSEDGHVGSVMSALTLPVIKADWQIDSSGVDERVARFVRSELGLPAPGEAQARRRRQGISWRVHVEQACHQLWAGFMPFEQVYGIGPANADQEGFDGDVIHLRKLAPRLPRTITRIATEADGGLKAIYQQLNDHTGGGRREIEIGVERLVFYSHKMEGADWSGRSILRQAYKHWLIKDVLLRLDAQAAERNSMGVPTMEYDPAEPGQQETARQVVTNLRAGHSAGAHYPAGMNLKIQGVQGQTVDLIPRIKYNDQEISRSALAMFMDLGHDRGSQSLGETFHGVFMDAVQSFADSIAEVATEHIIRDLVELNFGPDEPYPTLTPGDLKASEGINSESLTRLVTAGVVRADDDLEAYIRTQNGLPAAKAETARVVDNRAEIIGTLIRAGYTPETAATIAGIEGLEHTGLAPVTVQSLRSQIDPESGLPNPALNPTESTGEPAAALGMDGSQPPLPDVDTLLGQLALDYQKRENKRAQVEGQ